MFIITIIIFIPITQQPEQDRLAENQPMAGLSSLNEYENGMRKSETELKIHKKKWDLFIFQSEVNTANRTSETILKNVGAEKKVPDSKVLKKLSGDEAVQVRWIFPKILKGVTENRHWYL